MMTCSAVMNEPKHAMNSGMSELKTISTEFILVWNLIQKLLQSKYVCQKLSYNFINKMAEMFN
jgi:hypothetical protein